MFFCLFTVLAAIEVKISGLFHGPENGDVPYTVQAETVQQGIPNVPSHTRGVPDEQRLLRHLFHGYERTVRPVRNASTPVVIRMGLTLTQIFDMVGYLRSNLGYFQIVLKK